MSYARYDDRLNRPMCAHTAERVNDGEEENVSECEYGAVGVW